MRVISQYYNGALCCMGLHPALLLRLQLLYLSVKVENVQVVDGPPLLREKGYFSTKFPRPGETGSIL